MDLRKLKKETIKKYRKAGLTRGKATERVNQKIKEFKKEIAFKNDIANFFEKHNINILEFYIETENGNNESFLFDLKERKVVEEVEADLKFSNTDKENFINLNNLDLLNFHIFCASISIVFEEERAKEDAKYLSEIYFRCFIECLFYYQYNTFRKLKEEIKKFFK